MHCAHTSASSFSSSHNSNAMMSTTRKWCMSRLLLVVILVCTCFHQRPWTPAAAAANPIDRDVSHSSVESRLPIHQLMESGSSFLPAYTSPVGITRTISDTYEKEIEQQRAAQRVNDQQSQEMLSGFGERVAPPCPLDGTFHQLRRFGQRLFYEGDVTLARACFQKGIDLYLNPTNTIQPSDRNFKHEIAPTDQEKYKRILLETSSMHEKEFEDFGHVVDLIQERTERTYSLPWSAVRPRLHDRMVKDGTLVHDPHLRAIAEKQKKAKQLARKKKRQQRRQKKQKQQHQTSTSKQTATTTKTAANNRQHQTKRKKSSKTSKQPAQMKTPSDKKSAVHRERVSAEVKAKMTQKK